MRIRRNRKYKDIEPDEILLDAKNLPGYDPVQMEGKIERPIEGKVFRGFVFAAVAIALAFTGQLVKLQVVDAETLKARADSNSLSASLIPAERGLVTDRTGVALAENAIVDEKTVRVYSLGAAAAQLIGYVTYPKKDTSGNYYQENLEGIAGIEAEMHEALRGADGEELTETTATGESVSGSIVRPAEKGKTIALSVDAGLQKELYGAIKARADSAGFVGGSGVIMDVMTGEVVAIASYPSFDPEAVSVGGPGTAAGFQDSRAPFLDRAIAGLYSPGSVVKPFVAAAALTEGVITPEKMILSTGSITVPNPYDPAHPTIFKDWRANGWTDVRKAIAYSADVYFYEVGGGYSGPDGPDQAGLGIANLKKYFELFGISDRSGIPLPGEVEGVIPDPAWKAANFDGEAWYLGNTYHTAIGQYGVQVTPLALARATAVVANGGTLVTPTLTAGTSGARKHVPIPAENLQIVREGMRLAVTDPLGTAKALAIPGLAVGAKTGTAQIGVRNEYTNSTVIGFFPYATPRYAFALVMERAKAGASGAPATMGEVLTWVVANRPDMVK